MANGNPTPRRRPDDDQEGGTPAPPRPRNFAGVALVVLILVILYLVIQNHIAEPAKVKFPQFLEYLLQGKVEKVQVEKNVLEVTLKNKEKGRVGDSVRVIVPEKIVVEKAVDLEELADIGKQAADNGSPEDLRLHLAQVVHDKKDRGFVVYRRYLVKSGGRDLLLIRMSRPPVDDAKGAGGVSDWRSTGMGVAYLLEPGEVSGPGDKKYTLTTTELLAATNAIAENAEHGLPAPSAVTTPLLVSKGVFDFTEDPGLMQTLLLSLAPWLVIIVLLWFFIIRQMRSNGMGGNVLSFGRSRARIASREKSNVTFSDVAGIEEAKDEVGEIVEFLKHPGRFSRLGGRTPRGVLLVGLPGTGKTLLAKAIAGEADVPFYSICGSDFVEMFVGVGASRVRDLFKQARENSPCIIFLDEIDAVGRRRGAGLGGGHDEREQTLNAILVEMDGFETDTGIIVIAATNRVDVLDPALLRPGRFDRQIAVDLPDAKGREAILRVHARKVKVHPSVDFARVARGTPGFSGAELEAVVNEAAIIATLAKKDYVYLEDLEEGRDRVRWGRAKTSRILDEGEQRVTAYHEAGHALTAWLLPHAQPLHKVTIIPRGQALGATMYLPEKDEYSMTLAKIDAHLQVCFGGRVAEELFCGDISSGAANDIKQATNLARRMVREWGMSEAVGPICFEENDDPVFIGRDIARSANYSEMTVELIDTEVKRIVDGAYQGCRRLLVENKEQLERLAHALLEFEVLGREEIEGLFNGESVEQVRARLETATRSFDREAEVVAPKKAEASPVPETKPDFPPGLAGEGAG